MRAKLAQWLWEVLARPMLAHIDKWANHHADLISQKIRYAEGGVALAMAEIVNLRTQVKRLEDDLAAVRFNTQLIIAQMAQHTDFRQFEAVNFAAEKMVLDKDFWKQARADTRITAIMDWSKIYLAKNNWPVPDDAKLRGLVCAKLEQITERKVGPTQ